MKKENKSTLEGLTVMIQDRLESLQLDIQTFRSDLDDENSGNDNNYDDIKEALTSVHTSLGEAADSLDEAEFSLVNPEEDIEEESE